MRSIFSAIIMLSVSATVADTAQAEKHGYARALIGHVQPIEVSRDPIGVEWVQPEEDALTRRIERDKARLDRLIEICPSC
jgi:hypothetical protein